jgi:hypothetical protein
MNEQLFRTTHSKMMAIAGELAADRMGLDPGQIDSDNMPQWLNLRDLYMHQAMENLATALAGLATMDLDVGPESPAPPPHLR